MPVSLVKLEMGDFFLLRMGLYYKGYQLIYFKGENLMLSSLYRSSLFIGDVLLVNCAMILALLLRFEFQVPKAYWTIYLGTFVMLTFINICMNIFFRLYKCILQYISLRDMICLVASNILSTLIFILYSQLTSHTQPYSVYVIYLSLLLLGMIASRLSFRVLIKFYHHFKFAVASNTHKADPSTEIPYTRTLLVGAGEAGILLIKEATKLTHIHRHIIVAVDDAKTKQSSTIMGVPIAGTISDIPRLVNDYQIDEILIAIPSMSKKRTSEVATLCSQTSCKLRIFPGICKSLTSSGQLMVRNVSIEDLLGRDEIILDNQELSSHIGGKTILVTGGGGSELCRQIASFNPDCLIIFDIYENNAYDIQNELIRSGIRPEALKTIIGSVRDKKKLKDVFRNYAPDIVFHAAAHKHVPLMEESPEEAIKNNVFGTLNVALCAREYRAAKFILISTDKAVNPTNVMGASKRLCEMIIQGINPTTTHTDYVAVRFGNVLGSNGSVVPLFKRQLESGSPLTVTHPDIIRYFMTIPEAVRLILQAMTFATGGEIFVLDMGDPVKIYDLAVNFIKLSGLEPHKDVDIVFTGLRPGEKLYEELLMNEEGLTQTSSSKIFIGQPSHINFNDLIKDLEHLGTCLHNKTLIRQELTRIVPTYQTPAQANKAVPSYLLGTSKAEGKESAKAV